MDGPEDALHAPPDPGVLLSAIEASGEAILITSAELDHPGPRIEYVNPAFTHMTGYESREVVGRSPRMLQGPRTERAVLDRMRAALTAGEPFQGEAVNYRKDRATYTVEWLITPVRDDGGRIVHWVSAQRDVTERRAAETALRDSEERFAQFASSSSDALWIRDAATLGMEYVSPAARTIYGVPPEAMLDGVENWTALIVPEDRQTALAHLERARAGDAVVHEFRVRRPSDGAVRWIRDTDFPIRDAHGRVRRIGGIAEDVTGVKLLSERQEVLVAELQHRTRNLIAVVRAVANDTMDHTGPTEAFREAFADRLSALSRVQGLLSRAEVEPITIAALVRLELDAVGTDAADSRVEVDGPEVLLKPSTVQTLALAVHELAINARRHGALSHEHGRLEVRWRERDGDGGPRLALDWAESGLDLASERPASARRDSGYGRELIEHALPHALGARTTYALTGSGVRCAIDIPVRAGSKEAADEGGRHGPDGDPVCVSPSPSS